jgi:hypothetical protein
MILSITIAGTLPLRSVLTSGTDGIIAIMDGMVITEIMVTIIPDRVIIHIMTIGIIIQTGTQTQVIPHAGILVTTWFIHHAGIQGTTQKRLPAIIVMY